MTEEKVIDGIVHPFACRAWACAPARHGGRGVKNGDERKRVEGEGGSGGRHTPCLPEKWMDLSRTKWESAYECDIKCNILNGGAHGHRLWCVGEGGEGGMLKTIIPFCARTRHEGQVPRPRDPPYCASVPPTPTRGIIRNNPKSMSLQLADIRRPACECRSVPMAGSNENCRK